MAMSTKQIAGDESVHYVSARKKRAKPRPKMQPPLTPMIDVTFQLLLFFLLSFQFRAMEGQIPGTLPEEGEGGVTTASRLSEPLRILVSPVGRERVKAVFEVQGLMGTFETGKSLGAELQKQAKQRGKDVPVIIQARHDVQWRWVVEAFNQSVRARFKNVGFVTAS